MITLTSENYKEIMANNKLIGQFIKALPELEYCVGDADGKAFCYSPKEILGGNSPYQQKKECERFLAEQKEKGRMFKDDVVHKVENYPAYHQNMNEIFNAINYIEETYKAKVIYENLSMTGAKVVAIRWHRTNDHRDIHSSASNKDHHHAFYQAIVGFIKSVQSWETTGGEIGPGVSAGPDKPTSNG